jgi:hypothetical protein
MVQNLEPNKEDQTIKAFLDKIIALSQKVSTNLATDLQTFLALAREEVAPNAEIQRLLLEQRYYHLDFESQIRQLKEFLLQTVISSKDSFWNFFVQYPIYSTVNLEIYGTGFQPYFCA